MCIAVVLTETAPYGAKLASTAPAESAPSRFILGLWVEEDGRFTSMSAQLICLSVR